LSNIHLKVSAENVSKKPESFGVHDKYLGCSMENFDWTSKLDRDQEGNNVPRGLCGEGHKIIR